MLRDLRPQSIPYEALNAAAGYAANNVIQGFNVLDARRSESIVRQLRFGRDYAELELGSAQDMPLVLVENEVTVDERHSSWKDVTGERYHFPNQYRNRVIEGREFVYYRGVRRSDGTRGTPEYFGRGRIGEVWRDPEVPESAPKVEWKWF